MSDTVSSVSEVSKPTEVIVVTGATRCGKTSFTKLVKSFTKQWEVVKYIHQDDYFIDPKEMPKVSLQGAPFVKITYWDDDKCIDWSELLLNVNAALNDTVKPKLVIVEGNMLISCKPLLKLATLVIAISIDKWTCFDRRVSSNDKRQHYMPYMIKMWKSHVARFENIVDDSKTVFVSQRDLTAALNRDFVSASSVVHLVSRDFTWRQFMEELIMDQRYSPHHVPVVVENKNSVYGIELAKKMASKSLFATLVDKVHGMLLGVALGDAAGAPFEFHRGKPVVWSDGKMNVPLVLSGRGGGVRGAPPGAVTDDFQMTFLVLMHLVANNFSYDSKKQIMKYIKWASSHPGGIGTNTRDLFQHALIKDESKTMQKYLDAFQSKHADPDKRSMSNGTLMRASAFAICPDRATAILNSVKDARVSNDNLVNICANAIYVAFAHDLLGNRVVGVAYHIDPLFMLNIETLLMENELFPSLGNETFKRVKEVVYHAIESPHLTAREGVDMSQLVNSKDKKGFVLVALWVAFRYYRKWRNLTASQRTSVGELIRQVVCLGGDCDTNAAIFGGLIGADVGADYLLVCESDNLEVVLNVEYRYSTVKNVDNLTPVALPKYLDKLYDLYAGVASIEQEESEHSTSSTSSKRKQSNDEDDNDDDETEDFDPETVRSEKKAKITK